ncbi:DNA-directed RNA polymerase subunit RPC12/RpoP [Kluyvera sp. 1366]|jgi:DNA-directed RNA polymerase subunit RPC12/RpoP
MSEMQHEDVCVTCQNSLHDSMVIEKNGEMFKSCPSCSSKARLHIFYKYNDFGMRNMGDGRFIVQSWCRGCRLQDGAHPHKEFTC